MYKLFRPVSQNINNNHMLVKPSKEPKFCKYFEYNDFKCSPQQIHKLREQLNTEVIKVNLMNPFTAKDLPKYTKQQLCPVLLFMGRQMDELNIRNFNVSYLEQFISLYFEDLAEILSTKDFHCVIFCLSINRYLQEVVRSKEVNCINQKIKVTPIVDLLLTVYERINLGDSIHKKDVKSKTDKAVLLPLLQALMGYASLKFIRETNEVDINDSGYVEKAIRVAIVAIDQVSKQAEFELVTDFVHYTSHLLIFNDQMVRPIKFYQFCLELHQGIAMDSNKSSQKINQLFYKMFFERLGIYIKTDPSYLNTLLKMIRNLLDLQIINEHLISHFQVLIQIIRERLFPDLKKRLYAILTEIEDKKLFDFIDRLYEELLSFDPDVIDIETQLSNLKLAEKGNRARKQKFVEVYYYAATKSNKRLTSETINFIMKTYLELKMKLMEIDVFIKREASMFQTQTITKLHEVIFSSGDKSYIALLDVFLERKMDIGLKKSKKYNEINPFVHPDWLEATGNCSEVYELYLKMLVATLGSKTLEIKPKLINLNSIIIKINDNFFNEGMDYYKSILAGANKNQVFNQTMFKYMMICQAIFGQHLEITSYKYFSIFLAQIAGQEQVDAVIFLLEYLVRLLKNKSSVLLYLQAILQFQRSQQQFYNKKLYDIYFLAVLIEQSQYFKITTYSIQSLTVLHQLSILVNDQNFQKNSIAIIKAWSSLINRNECNNLCYLFCFREIKRIFPFISEKQNKPNRERILKLWNMIIQLLDYDVQPLQYIRTQGNRLMIMWHGENTSKDTKKGIQINGNFLRNQNIEINWELLVIVTSYKSYEVFVNNDRCYIYQRQSKQANKENKVVIKQLTIKELKKNPQKISFSFKIEALPKAKANLSLTILGQPIETQLEGFIVSMQILNNADVYLYGISIINLVSGDSLKKLHQHLTLLNYWEVRISSLSKIGFVNFLNKLDFVQLFCMLGEMMRHFKQCNPVEGYKMFVKLSCRMFKELQKHAPHRQIPYQIQIMNTIYSLVQKGFTNIKHISDIEVSIDLENPNRYSYYLYYLFVFAFLPSDIWRLLSQQSKASLFKILEGCIKNAQFRQVENSSTQLFEMLCSLDYDLNQIFRITNEILVSHHTNIFLTRKFEHYIRMTQIIEEFAINLTVFLDDLIKCISSDNHEAIPKKILCKFLIIQTSILEVVFIFCSSSSKISLIHYLVYNPFNGGDKAKQQSSKFKDLVGLMQSQQRKQLIGLLIIELQQDALPKFLKRKLSNTVKKSVIQETRASDGLYTHLYLLIRLWDEIDSETFEDVVIILLTFLKSKVCDKDLKDTIQIQTENTICTREYVLFLHNLKCGRYRQMQKYKGDFDQIFKISFLIIATSAKNKFIRFMKHYEEFASNSLYFALLPLESSQFKQFKIYSHAVILQYIYQVLIKIKYKDCFNGQKEQLQFSQAAIKFMQYFASHIQTTNQISNALIYVFPKLAADKDSSTERLVTRILRAQKQIFPQLKGGIYFKLMLITLQLLESCYHIDFTNILQLLLLKKSKARTRMSSSRFGDGNIGNIGNFLGKQRNPLQIQLESVEQEHSLYYKQEEKGQQKDIPQQQFDLSSSLLQFFLMRLCQFLQNYSDGLDEQILNSYSSIVLTLLKHTRISKEISSDNQYTPYNILKYQDIIYLRGQQADIASTPMLNPLSPQALNSHRERRYSQERISININTSQFTNNQSPPRKRRKTVDLQAEQNLRNEMFQELSKDAKQWGKKLRNMNFARFFGSKPKEIRFIQFLHIHTLLKKKEQSVQIGSLTIIETNELQKLVERNDKEMRTSKSKPDMRKLQLAIRKVKKIYPYTSPGRTVVRIMDNCLSNMACPVTQLVTCKDYSLKKMRNKESLNMINYEMEFLDEQSSQNESPMKDTVEVEIFQDEFYDTEEQMKNGKHYCQLVTRDGVYFCQWQLNEQELKLKPKENRPSNNEFIYLIYGTPEDNLLKKNLSEFKIAFSEMEEIFQRKFSQMMNSIEIFLRNGTSRFITFYTKQKLGIFLRKFQQLTNNFKNMKFVKDPPKQFSQLNYTERWIQGYLSNFDYLMMLNKYSGRTHNDINQYYIFPWILREYQSDSLDITDYSNYRDLSKPMGALNPQKLKRYKQIYKINQGSHFYGSHYSTSLFVLYYMVRLQPFSTLHREMQKGNFDLADRLFSSVYQVWDTLMSDSSTSDIKELIPEFYYMPSFLKNVGNIEFGQKMCGQEVSDVVLPPWASSPEQFVVTLRAALESDYVSQNLHLWIDLIFGKHQCSEEKYNMFMPITYEEKIQAQWIDLMKKPKEMEATIAQITYFGQCPSKLFNKEHKPKRATPDIKPKRSSLKRALSQTTTSFTYEQANILVGWKLLNIINDNSRFYLQFESIHGKKEFGQVVVGANASFEQLKQSLQDMKISTKRRSESKFKKRENLQLHKSQLRIGRETIASLEMNFGFEEIQANDMWIACFGLQGLRVYNWQQELFWRWEKEQISMVHIEPTRLIFATPSGKVCFYSFYDGKMQETQAIRDCSVMHVRIICLPRLPCRDPKNQSHYRLLCVGDQRKVALVSYSFEQTLNQTSARNMRRQ